MHGFRPEEHENLHHTKILELKIKRKEGRTYKLATAIGTPIFLKELQSRVVVINEVS